MLGFCVALAMALLSTFLTSPAARLRENARIRSASSAFMPRTRSTTSRAFCGDILTNRAIAFASMTSLSPIFPFHRPWRLLAHLGLAVAGVAEERPRRCELPELVAHHVLRDEHGDELLAVVHGKGVPDELRGDGGAARPSLDDPPVPARIGSPDLLRKLRLDVRTFLD